ncbi:redox-regulated ATPase YchF [Candidatus Poribacteria bacterium]|nr:redox-regulated ATPase YchF [Candidatus Poribacteria bacterium]
MQKRPSFWEKLGLFQEKGGRLNMQIGIIGMPYVGKTTLFNALTKAKAETGTYAGRMDFNLGEVKVPEERLELLAAIFKPKKIVPASIEYIDIGGIAKGVVEKGGMDADLLATLRNIDALAHVVRVFEDDNVPHVEGNIDPQRDIKNLNVELALADLQIIEKRLERLVRELRTTKIPVLVHEQELLEKFRHFLESNVPLREIDISDGEELMIRGYQFLSQKPLLLILNIGEEQIGDSDTLIEQLSEFTQKPKTKALAVCAQLEMEIAALDAEDAAVFIEDLGLKESAMTRVIHTSYELLSLITFFTGGDNEVRAWTAKQGTTAISAAGMIHSDMERGFIRAETIQADDLIRCGSLAKAREAGLLRLEGKEYLVKDKDFLTIRFSV